jgi:hypothetical protein
VTAVVPNTVCPACGASLPSGYAFCNRCGASLTDGKPVPADKRFDRPAPIAFPATTTVVESTPERPRASRLAVAAFIVGMLGLAFFVVGLVALAGLVLGFVSLAYVRKRPGRHGRALSWSGIACSVFGIVLFVSAMIDMSDSVAVPEALAAEDAQIVSALERLHAAQTVFRAEFDTYCDDFALLEYSAPTNVRVEILSSDPTEYAAEAGPTDDDAPVYHVTQDGVVREGSPPAAPSP